MKADKYWDNRYKRGITSGRGSIGKYRKFKWEIISKFVNIKDCSVIDVGCGDLQFWEGKMCKNYIGIDISKMIIEKNKKLRPEWNFICEDISIKQNISTDVVICLDVLFHILIDADFGQILSNLCEYSNKYIFIYTWIKNPFNNRTTDNIYQKYRNMNDYTNVFADNNFYTSIYPCPFDIGGMYVSIKTNLDVKYGDIK